MATKTKRVRWECPNGCKGALGPTRPRKDNVVRYCLTCSAKTGKLVERAAPSLEAKRQTKAQAAAERAKAKAAAAKAREDAKWMIDGVDLRKALKTALKLPTAAKVYGRNRREPEIVLAHSKTKGYSTGHAYIGENKITMTLGLSATAQRAVGLLLHELAHHVCYYSGENFKDASRAFVRRCHDLHDEWNEKAPWGVLVKKSISGAYRGSGNVRGKHEIDDIPVVKKAATSSSTAQLARAIAQIRSNRVSWRDLVEPGSVLKISPSVWTEFQCVKLDTADDENGREWMVEWCDEHETYKARQHQLTLPADLKLTLQLVEEIEDAVNFHGESNVMMGWDKMWARIALTKL